jgi:serine/threonine protein kinase
MSSLNDSTIEPSKDMLGGRYEVIRPLGRGGIGKVFLVRDMQTGDELALKMLRTRYQDSERAIKRFEREVSALRKLDHPCIVKILDVQKTDAYFFYTMEYVEGKSVRKWMQQRGRLEFGSVVRVLSLMAHGLEHAHQVTVHRDISPENVMVMKDGSVRLLDFGLAKLDDVHSNLTMVGVSLGKLAYMSPEQRASATDVDARADIYPLGVMFYEMLTGELPHPSHRFSELRPDLPLECEAFLEKAMAPEPDDRFANAREFRHALAKLYELYKARLSELRKAPPTVELRPFAETQELHAKGLGRVVAWLRGLFRRKPRAAPSAASTLSDLPTANTSMDNVPSLATVDENFKTRE